MERVKAQVRLRELAELVEFHLPHGGSEDKGFLNSVADWFDEYDARVADGSVETEEQD